MTETNYFVELNQVKCDIEKSKGLGDLFDVKSIPTLLFFCDSEIKKRTRGKYNAEKLEQELEDLLEGCPT